MATNITASANFQAIIQEVQKLAQTYADYNQQVGKTVGANIRLINSIEDVAVAIELQASAQKRLNTQNSKAVVNPNGYTSSLAPIIKNIATSMEAQALAQANVNKANATAKRISAPPVQRAPRDPNAPQRIPSTSGGVNSINKSYERYIELADFVKGANVKLALSFFALNKQLLVSAQSMQTISASMGSTVKSTSSFTQAMTQVAKSTQDMSNATKTGEERVSSLSLSFESFVRLGVVSLAHKAITAFTSGLKSSLDTAIDYEVQIGRIQAISTDVPLSFDRWAKSIRGVSSEFNIDLIDATRATYQALSNQVVKGADTFEFLAGNAKLASIAQGTLEQAVDATSSVLKSYGKSVFDANDIEAKLFKTTELGRIKLSNIANQLGTVTALASQAGVSFEEVGASLATITVQGVSETTALTFLRNMLLNVLKPTEAMKSAIEKMGFASAEAGLRTLGLGKFLAELQATTHGTTSEMVELFGNIRGANGAIATSTDSLKVYNEALEGISNSGKDFNDRFDLSTQNFGFQFSKQINQVKNDLVGLTEKFGENILLPIIDSLGGLSNIVDVLGKSLLSLAILGTYQALLKMATAISAVAIESGALNAILLELNIQQVLLGNNSIVTAGKLAFFNSSLVAVAVGVGKLLLAYAPLILAFGAIYFGIKKVTDAINAENDAFDEQTKQAESLRTKLAQVSQKQLNDVIGYYARVEKERLSSGNNESRDNIRKLGVLKDSLKESEKAYKKYSKNSLDDSKVILNTLEQEGKKIKETLKLTNDFLEAIGKTKEKLNDDLFGKGFTAKLNLSSDVSNFDKAIKSGIAENITEATKQAIEDFEAVIASTDDQALTSKLKKQLLEIINTSAEAITKIRDESFKSEIKNTKEVGKLKVDIAKRTEAQNILNRSNSVDIVKSTTPEEAILQGGARISELQRAKDLVFSEKDKASIEALISEITETTTRKVSQLRDKISDENLRELIKKQSDQIKIYRDSIQKEIDTVNSSAILATNLSTLGNGGNTVLDAITKDRTKFITRSDRSGERQKQEEASKILFGTIGRVQGSIREGKNVDPNDIANLKQTIASLKGDFLKTAQPEIKKAILELDASLNSLDFNLTNNLTKFKEIVAVVTEFGDVTGDGAVKQTIFNRELARGIPSALAKKAKEVADAKANLRGTTNSIDEAGRPSNFLENQNLVLDEAKKQTATTQLETITEDGVSTGATNGITSGSFENALSDIVKRTLEGPFDFRTSGTGAKTVPLTSEEKKLLASQANQQSRADNQAKEEKRQQAVFDEAKKSGKSVTDLSKPFLLSQDAVETAKKDIAKLEEDSKTLRGLEKEQKEEEIRIKKVELQKLKNESNKKEENLINILLEDKKLERQIKVNDTKTLLGRFNQLGEGRTPEQKARDIQLGKDISNVSDSVASLGSVIDGTSRKIDLSGIRALELGKNFNLATAGVEFFANALLAPKRRGLTSQQKLGALLQGTAAGASAGSVAGPYGALVGGALGFATSAFQIYSQKGGLVYRANGGEVSYLNRGGSPNGGAPRGSDTIPAMLTRGEFVMNKGATDKFYSQIKAMNSYSHFSDGGRVQNSNTNVGDINLHLPNGSANTSVDVRGLGNQLRREIKRGRLGKF